MEQILFPLFCILYHKYYYKYMVLKDNTGEMSLRDDRKRKNLMRV